MCCCRSSGEFPRSGRTGLEVRSHQTCSNSTLNRFTGIWQAAGWFVQEVWRSWTQWFRSGECHGRALSFCGSVQCCTTRVVRYFSAYPLAATHETEGRTTRLVQELLANYSQIVRFNFRTALPSLTVGVRRRSVPGGSRPVIVGPTMTSYCEFAFPSLIGSRGSEALRANRAYQLGIGAASRLVVDRPPKPDCRRSSAATAGFDSPLHAKSFDASGGSDADFTCIRLPTNARISCLFANTR